MKHRLDFISSEDGIEAVLGEPTEAMLAGERGWRGSLGSLKAHGVGGQLIAPDRAVFDAELTARWGRLVACTREFAAWWAAPERASAAAPVADFFMEVDV